MNEEFDLDLDYKPSDLDEYEEAMIVVITGDRNWNDYDLIYNRLVKLPSGTLVVVGRARGADRLAEKAADAIGLPTCPIEADWDTYHRAAGPIRNRNMLNKKPNVVLAFHDDLASSKGTKDCVRQAKQMNLTVEMVNHQHPDGILLTEEDSNLWKK